MIRKLIVGGLIAGCLMTAAPVLAQTAPRQPAAAAVSRPLVLAMRARMLRERVGLDETTAQRVEQVLARFDAEHATVRELVRVNVQRIRQLLRENSTDQAAYRQAVEGLRNAQRQQQALIDREFDELKTILVPSQQARLLMQLRRLNQAGWGGGGMGPGAGPGRGGGMGPGLGPCGGGNGPCGRGMGRGRAP